jgi:hypothetical protein
MSDRPGQSETSGLAGLLYSSPCKVFEFKQQYKMFVAQMLVPAWKRSFYHLHPHSHFELVAGWLACQEEESSIRAMKKKMFSDVVQKVSVLTLARDCVVQ